MAVLRNVGGFLAGLFVGSLVNMGVLSISWAIWPIPDGLDINDSAQLAEYVEGLPAAAFALVLIAHLGQAVAGGWLGARIAAHPFAVAMVIAVLTFLGSLYNLLVLPAPGWMWVELPLILGAGFFIGRGEAGRREKSEAGS